MNWKTQLDKWLTSNELDAELKEELFVMKENEKEAEDAFYKNLEFGTGGMRGELGPGTNRLNVYMVRKATEGLACYIDESGQEAKKKGVVVAYDSRHKSPEFALEVAKVLGHTMGSKRMYSMSFVQRLSFLMRCVSIESS